MRLVGLHQLQVNHASLPSFSLSLALVSSTTALMSIDRLCSKGLQHGFMRGATAVGQSYSDLAQSDWIILYLSAPVIRVVSDDFLPHQHSHSPARPIQNRGTQSCHSDRFISCLTRSFLFVAESVTLVALSASGRIYVATRSSFRPSYPYSFHSKVILARYHLRRGLASIINCSNGHRNRLHLCLRRPGRASASQGCRYPRYVHVCP